MPRSLNPSWTAALRRHLAAALGVLMLVASVWPAHAGGPAALAGPVASIAKQAAVPSGAPAAADAVPGHPAALCACKIATLPDTVPLVAPTAVRAAAYAVAPAPCLLATILAPPGEPPRL